MNITDFVNYLRNRKREPFATQAEIAKHLGTQSAQLSNWLKQGKHLTNLEIAGLIARTRRVAAEEGAEKALHSAIRPIVEFFPIEPVESKQGANWEPFHTGQDAPLPDKGLRKELEKARGIYLFYDSRGQALYAGKTVRNTLWAEMKSAFNRDRKHQKLNRIKHPGRNQEFVPASKKLRPIKQTSVRLVEMAAYFSAYEITPGIIDDVEAILIRAFANDLLNTRMEKFRS